MQRLIVIIFIALCPIVICGQESENKTTDPTSHKNEFGLNLFSITNLTRFKVPEYNFVDVYNPYYNINYNISSGIYYKRYCGKNALRLSFDYYQKAVGQSLEIPYNGGWTYYDYYSGTKKDYQIKVGYERLFGSKRLLPFVFADLFFNYGKYTGYRFYNGESVFVNTTNGNFYLENLQYGAALGGGLKYHLNKHIVISYEFSATASYWTVQDISQGYNKYGDIAFRINPIRQLGLAISF